MDQHRCRLPILWWWTRVKSWECPECGEKWVVLDYFEGKTWEVQA